MAPHAAGALCLNSGTVQAERRRKERENALAGLRSADRTTICSSEEWQINHACRPRPDHLCVDGIRDACPPRDETTASRERTVSWGPRPLRRQQDALCVFGIVI